MPTTAPMTIRFGAYLERVARDIYHETGGEGEYPANEATLWLTYALLCVAKGTETTARNVHDAWAVWAIQEYDGTHRSLVPFDQLSPEVQALDIPYRDAIRRVAERHQGRRTIGRYVTYPKG